jgi:hypothetical protein
MILPMLVKTIPAVTACLAIASVAIASGATAADSPPTAPVPPRDSFRGQVTSATGKLKEDRDRVQIELLRTTGGDSRAVTITLAGPRCHHRRHCSRVAGTLRGTMIPRASRPDAGEQFALCLKGNVRPLGHVTARGTAHGTGFITYGYESLHLTLTDASARVTIDAQSGRVPGFTSP